MANAKDLTANVVPRFLIVGDSGTHKTFFLSQIPGIYIFDFDVGMLIARGKDVEYDTFKDAPRGGRTKTTEGIFPYGTAWPKFIAKLNYIGSKIDKDEWKLPDGSLRPIGVDSLTTMANSALAHALDQANYTGNPQIQHWGAQMNLLETVMEQLNSWPMPLFVTAHLQRDTNDITNNVEFLPLVTGKLAGKIGLYFNEVYFTTVKGSGSSRKFHFKTESDLNYKQAKTRLGVPDMIEMDWPKIQEAIRNPKPWGGAKDNEPAVKA